MVPQSGPRTERGIHLLCSSDERFSQVCSGLSAHPGYGYCAQDRLRQLGKA